jgi:anti-sigma regulatory factor (Ser/Thr protein kinase)
MCQHAPQVITSPAATCGQSFPGQHNQLRRARALIARFLDGCPAADDATLLISELAANAITYSASGRPGGIFIVRARRCGITCIYAEVEDQGSNWDGNVSNAEPPHGLYLLRKLSSDCGARRGDEGWVTWFTIAAAPLTA